jgi:hypothetical protein
MFNSQSLVFDVPIKKVICDVNMLKHDMVFQLILWNSLILTIIKRWQSLYKGPRNSQERQEIILHWFIKYVKWMKIYTLF